MTNLCNIVVENFFIKILQKMSTDKNDLKTRFRPSSVCKELSTTTLENKIFETVWLYWICNIKATENISKSSCVIPWMSYNRVFFKNNKMNWNKVPRHIFCSRIFLYFFCNITLTGQNSYFLMLTSPSQVIYWNVFFVS